MKTSRDKATMRLDSDRNTNRRLIIAAAACVLPLYPARAQPAPPSDLIQPNLPYHEVYLDNPKVSGNNLVGLRWKSALARFDPDGVHIERAAAAPFGKVCVEVMSEDGRYDAENTYDLGLSASLNPGFKSATRYVEQLGSYASETVSIIVHGQPCGTVALPPLIPAFLATSRDPHPASRELTAFLNADPNRVSATLVDPSGSGLPFACASAGTGVQIAYAVECIVAVPTNVHGEFILRVAQRERFKTVATDYRVRLP